MEPIFLKSLKKIVEGNRGAGPGKIRTGGGREAGGGGTGLRGRDAEDASRIFSLFFSKL